MNAYTDPRVVRPGCQHQLGCKCPIPFWLRPSSPEEERQATLLQTSSAKLDFITTGLRVVERRRDELKAELLRLRPPTDKMVEGDL